MKTMPKLGDYVVHRSTDKIGQVVAYGHQIIDGAYLPTLTVEVVNNSGMRKKIFVEDVTDVWVGVEPEKVSQIKMQADENLAIAN